MSRAALVRIAVTFMLVHPALAMQTQQATSPRNVPPSPLPNWQTRLVEPREIAGDKVPIGTSRPDPKKRPHYGVVREF